MIRLEPVVGVTLTFILRVGGFCRIFILQSRHTHRLDTTGTYGISIWPVPKLSPEKHHHTE